MAEEIKVGSTKRFGARYGRKVKRRFGVIEAEQRKLHKCPYCNAFKVKRIVVGIWRCRKCGAKFTGKAYSIGKKITFKEEAEEMPEEETREDIVEEDGPEEKEIQDKSIEKGVEKQTVITEKRGVEV